MEDIVTAYFIVSFNACSNLSLYKGFEYKTNREIGRCDDWISSSYRNVTILIETYKILNAL